MGSEEVLKRPRVQTEADMFEETPRKPLGSDFQRLQAKPGRAGPNLSGSSLRVC